MNVYYEKCIDAGITDPDTIPEMVEFLKNAAIAWHCPDCPKHPGKLRLADQAQALLEKAGIEQLTLGLDG
jgi:hypothetical protein